MTVEELIKMLENIDKKVILKNSETLREFTSVSFYIGTNGEVYAEIE